MLSNRHIHPFSCMKKDPPKQQWQRLTPEQVDRITTDDRSFCEYLSTLNVEQIDAYIALVGDDTKMEAKSRDALLELLKYARTERTEADKQTMLMLTPLIRRIGRIVKIEEQIEQLEKISVETES